MNGLPYYKAYPRDFVEGTIGMPFEIKCAYRVVIDLIYMQGGRLPDDPRYISGLLGCSLRKWNAIRSELIQIGKLQLSDGFLSNDRSDKELEILSKYQENQSENASKPRKNKDLQKPRQRQRAIYTEPEPNNTPIPPQGGFDAFWSAYPRKVGKDAARKSYDRAMKKADPATVMSALLAWVPSQASKEAQFIPHASTWLNGGRWQDEPEAATPAGPPKPGDTRINYKGVKQTYHGAIAGWLND